MWNKDKRLFVIPAHSNKKNLEYRTILVSFFYLSYIVEVLQDSAVLLSPVDYLNMLPYEGNAQFFLPYIEKCYRQYQTRQLQDMIMAKGEQLSHNV